MSEELLGADPVTFFGLTVLLFGAAAMASGRALARNWRPLWQAVPYTMLLAAADRFLLFALFEGELVSATGFAIGWAICWPFHSWPIVPSRHD